MSCSPIELKSFPFRQVAFDVATTISQHEQNLAEESVHTRSPTLPSQIEHHSRHYRSTACRQNRHPSDQ